MYMEESEPKSDSSKDSSVANSPQISRKSPLYASADNLSFKPSLETAFSSNERGLTSSISNSSLKSLEQPATQTPQVEEPRSKTPPPLTTDVSKEAKENKKQENKKSSILSFVTGRKETPKAAEVEQVKDVSLKKEESKPPIGKRPTEVTSKKQSLNPFDEDLVEDKKAEPLPAERYAKTSAVKPRFVKLTALCF